MSSSFYSGSGLTNNEQDAIEGAKNAAEAARDAAQEAQAAAETAETNAEAAAASVTTGAATATTKASEASDSADTASTKADEAAASASAASTSASAASTSASSASTSASASAASASAASTDADDAASAKTAAETAQAAAEAALADFEGIYLGAHASDPTVDANNDPVNEGDLYFNTTDDRLLVYNGTAWVLSGITTVATSTDDGLMSSSDKSKLDAINQELSTTSSPTFDGSNITNVEAASVSVSESSDNNVDYNILFSDTDGSGGIQMTPIQDDGGLYYNPLYNTLSTGNIYLSGGSLGSYITFEGVSTNDFETTLRVTNPTADRIILLPDAGGTLALNDVATTSDNGLMSSTDKSKLDGIETGADVTDAANVEPLVDSHLNTSTAATGEYLKWDGTDYDWASVPPGYTDSDVDTHLNTSGASNGQYLEWNGTDYQWSSVDLSTKMDVSGGTFTGDVTIDGSSLTLFDEAHDTLGTYDTSVDIRAYGDGQIWGYPAVGSSAIYFNKDTQFGGDMYVYAGNSDNYIDIERGRLRITQSGAHLRFQKSGFETDLNSDTLTADREIKLPDVDGTVVVANSDGQATLSGALARLTIDDTTSGSSSLRIQGGTDDRYFITVDNLNAETDSRLYLGVDAGYPLKLTRTQVSTSSEADLLLGANLLFEGATDDDFETTVTATDPTTDRTITLPDADGTVVLQDSNGDVSVSSGDKLIFGANGSAYITGEDGGPDSLEIYTDGSNRLTVDQYGILAANGLPFSYQNAAGTFYTNLEATDPTADRTITFPDASGNLAVQTSDGFLQLQSASGSQDVGINLDAVGSTSRSNFSIGPRQNFDHWQIDVDPSNVEDYSSLTLRVDDQDYIRIGPNTTIEVSEMVTIQKPTKFNFNAGGTPITFEGATNDGFELRLNVTDPTADQTITLPDQTGTSMLWRNEMPDESVSSGQGGTGISGNIAIGYDALQAPNTYTTGYDNIAIGVLAFHNETEKTNLGHSNVAIGSKAGQNISSNGNTVIGHRAGRGANDFNTIVGTSAMDAATGTNDQNTVVGYAALNRYDGNGLYRNTVVGSNAASSLRDGDYNTLIGAYANTYFTNSNRNTAVGYNCKVGYRFNTSIGLEAGNSMYNQSDYCTLLGYKAGFDMDGGDYATYLGTFAGYGGGTNAGNVAVGYSALYQISSGGYNVAMGYQTGRGIQTGNSNTYVGYRSGYNSTNLSAADSVVAIGRYACFYGSSGDNVICIGSGTEPSSTTVANEITLGDSNITGLRCNVQTISSLSDERDKTAIEDLSYGLNFINDMRPVQYTWNRRDGTLGAKKDMGFIAQELYDVELDHSSTSRTRLVNWSNPNKLEADYVRTYPILVKAVQELSAKCDALEARIAELEGA